MVGPHAGATTLEPGGSGEPFRVPGGTVDQGGVLGPPPILDFERASFIEPLACAIRAVDRMHTKPKSALVLGAGPMGLLMIQLLRLRGTETPLPSEGSPMRAERARRLRAAPVWGPMTPDGPPPPGHDAEGLR